MENLKEQFGDIDIYLFDQLLKGRIAAGMRIFDAGCGVGRNLAYFLREGYDVFGVDCDSEAASRTERMAKRLMPGFPAGNIRCERLDEMSYPDAFADVVISSAVLHFAQNDADFNAMLRGSWRVLQPAGLFFCRLASSIGIERQIRQIDGRRFLLPDGSERYLVDEALLVELTEQLQAEWLEPLKTTVVQNQRSMTTWVLRKSV